jgi:hypothetical protein
MAVAMDKADPRARRIIRADGSVELLPKRLPLRALATLIRAEALDTVRLHHLGHPLMVMLVNDAGYEVDERTITRGRQTVTHLVPKRAVLPVNQFATVLYLANCVPGTTHQIVGDVVVAPDEDFA